jgi:hypothetical protein
MEFHTIPVDIQVSAYGFVLPLSSPVMAPGLPEIAIKYGITNSTIIGLTLSTFILSFAFAVSSRSHFYLNGHDPIGFSYDHVAFDPRPTLRDVRKDMGTSCFN